MGTRGRRWRHRMRMRGRRRMRHRLVNHPGLVIPAVKPIVIHRASSVTGNAAAALRRVLRFMALILESENQFGSEDHSRGKGVSFVTHFVSDR